MNNFLNGSKRFIKKNSSTILTCIGAVGVAATAIVSARDTVKAVELLKKKEDSDAKLSKKEVIKLTAPAYIPTVIVGVSTIICIFGANILNKRTQASLASAYALLDQSYKEYRGKVKEICGEDSDKKVRDAIAISHYNDKDRIQDDGKQVFFDFYSLQTFDSTMEKVLAAENAVNQLLEHNYSVSLATFYEMLGIECVDMDYEVGWSNCTVRECGYDHIVFVHDKVTKDDGTDFISITMATDPVPDYMWF